LIEGRGGRRVAGDETDERRPRWRRSTRCATGWRGCWRSPRRSPSLDVARELERAALTALAEQKPDRVLATNVEFWSAVVLELRPHGGLVGPHPRAEADGAADPPGVPVYGSGGAPAVSIDGVSDAVDRLGTEEVARRLGVKRKTVYTYVSRGLLERHSSSGPHDSRFDPEEVERLAARGRRPDRSSALEVVVETELTMLDPAWRLSYRVGTRSSRRASAASRKSWDCCGTARRRRPGGWTTSAPRRSRRWAPPSARTPPTPSASPP